MCFNFTLRNSFATLWTHFVTCVAYNLSHTLDIRQLDDDLSSGASHFTRATFLLLARSLSSSVCVCRPTWRKCAQLELTNVIIKPT